MVDTELLSHANEVRIVGLINTALQPAMSSANGLVDTGFVSLYRLRPESGVLKAYLGRCKATAPSSLSLTSNRVNYNY